MFPLHHPNAPLFMHQRGIEAFAWYTRLLVLLGMIMSGGFESSVAQNDKPTDSGKKMC